MKGLMGEIPDWYPSMQAARYLGVPWWDLIKQSIWFQQKALKAMNAEGQARQILDDAGV
jgi:hypothetical protein